MQEILIKSSDSDAVLSFSERTGDYFTTSISSIALVAKIQVWGYTDCDFLVDLFSYMAEEWKGWNGEVSWNSIDGEFHISAVSDHLGHIKLRVMFNKTEEPDPWQVQATISLEANQLDTISPRSKEFLQKKIN